MENFVEVFQSLSEQVVCSIFNSCWFIKHGMIDHQAFIYLFLCILNQVCIETGQESEDRYRLEIKNRYLIHHIRLIILKFNELLYLLAYYLFEKNQLAQIINSRDIQIHQPFRFHALFQHDIYRQMFTVNAFGQLKLNLSFTISSYLCL